MSKYSIKNICFGIGLGMIIASLINLNFGQQQLSKEDIKREAEKFNLIVLDKSVIEKSIVQPTPTPTPTLDTTPTVQQSNEKENIIKVTVNRGATSYEVANVLFSKGLIKDKQFFLDRLESLRKSNKLQIGDFEIKENSNIDEIIQILTTTP